MKKSLRLASGTAAGSPNEMNLPLLWHIPFSHFNEKVRWALDFKNVPHRRRCVGADYLFKAWRATGHGTLPILFLDGKAVGDSTDIIAALEQRQPEPALYPKDPAQLRRALDLEDFGDRAAPPGGGLPVDLVVVVARGIFAQLFEFAAPPYLALAMDSYTFAIQELCCHALSFANQIGIDAQLAAGRRDASDGPQAQPRRRFQIAGVEYVRSAFSRNTAERDAAHGSSGGQAGPCVLIRGLDLFGERQPQAQTPFPQSVMGDAESDRTLAASRKAYHVGQGDRDTAQRIAI